MSKRAGGKKRGSFHGLACDLCQTPNVKWSLESDYRCRRCFKQFGPRNPRKAPNVE